MKVHLQIKTEWLSPEPGRALLFKLNHQTMATRHHQPLGAIRNIIPQRPSMEFRLFDVWYACGRWADAVFRRRFQSDIPPNLPKNIYDKHLLTTYITSEVNVHSASIFHQCNVSRTNDDITASLLYFFKQSPVLTVWYLKKYIRPGWDSYLRP